MECRRRGGGWLRDYRYAGTAGQQELGVRACGFLLTTNATLSRWQASGSFTPCYNVHLGGQMEEK